MCYVCVQVYVFVFQRVHRLLLSQAPLAHLAHLAPLDPPVFQVRKLLLCSVFCRQLAFIAVYLVLNLTFDVYCPCQAAPSVRQDCSGSLDTHGPHPSLQEDQDLRLH